MSVTFAQGFSAAGVAAGISAVEGKKDLALVVNNGPLDAAAGVFTSNRFCAAPVQWSRNIVSDGHVKAVILNSGGANACTGKPGYEQSKATAEKVASLIGAKAEDVAVCSTGLIGELLPLDNVLSGADKAFETLADTAEAGADASHAIMTTDTKPKTVELEGSNGFRIGGMVKGSGMIAPQLATMLCVITTDAVVTAGQLQAALNAGVEMSFNRIDVDGCMSTNDTVLLLASGASGIEPEPDEFNELVAKATASLARQIIGDGEGASHDIRVKVTGATTEEAALACGRAVQSAQMRHLRQRSELGPYRQLPWHRAVRRRTIRFRKGHGGRQRRTHLRKRRSRTRPLRSGHDPTRGAHRHRPERRRSGSDRLDRRSDPRIRTHQR